MLKHFIPNLQALQPKSHKYDYHGRFFIRIMCTAQSNAEKKSLLDAARLTFHYRLHRAADIGLNSLFIGLCWKLKCKFYNS